MERAVQCATEVVQFVERSSVTASTPNTVAALSGCVPPDECFLLVKKVEWKEIGL
jgi:hypothetical protein